MRNAIRSELLRAVSGLSIVPVYLIALLMPAYVLFSDGSRFDLVGVPFEAATLRLIEPLAWSAISAAFIGAYAVTREFYYGSMERTLAGVGLRRAFVGKLVAAALITVALSIGVFVVWTLGVALCLSRQGLTLTLTLDAWRLYAGALLGVVLGAFIGAAIGWTTRNYYVTAALVLAVPMIVEFGLLRTSLAMVGFSPGLALAALGVPGYRGRLLEFFPALCVEVVWALLLIGIAWTVRRRRVG